MAILCTNDGRASDDGHFGEVHMATRLGPARTVPNHIIPAL